MLTSDLAAVASFVCRVADCPLPDPERSTAVGWVRDDEVIAGVVYEHWTGASVTATIAKEPATIINRELLHAMFHYPFEQVGVGLIIAFVAESNWRSRAIVEAMGFTKEAEIPGAYPDGAMMIYTMTRAQCRWLEKEDGQVEQN